jgi:hypothetical protein
MFVYHPDFGVYPNSSADMNKLSAHCGQGKEENNDRKNNRD